MRLRAAAVLCTNVEENVECCGAVEIRYFSCFDEVEIDRIINQMNKTRDQLVFG